MTLRPAVDELQGVGESRQAYASHRIRPCNFIEDALGRRFITKEFGHKTTVEYKKEKCISLVLTVHYLYYEVHNPTAALQPSYGSKYFQHE